MREGKWRENRSAGHPQGKAKVLPGWCPQVLRKGKKKTNGVGNGQIKHKNAKRVSVALKKN